jgi:hypothetical protein
VEEKDEVTTVIVLLRRSIASLSSWSQSSRISARAGVSLDVIYME